jgi:hypothetical protein
MPPTGILWGHQRRHAIKWGDQVTDESPPDFPIPTDEEIAASYKEPADGQLQSLIDWVNGTDTEMGITLMVGGLIVSGRLASSHRYFEEFADQLVSGITIDFSDTPDEDPAESLRLIRETFAMPGKQVTSIPPERRPAPRFIHLRQPSFRTGIVTVNPSLPGGKPAWWRGRLARVDGFFLGQMSTDDE